MEYLSSNQEDVLSPSFDEYDEESQMMNWGSSARRTAF